MTNMESLRILLAEDNSSVLALLKKFLQTTGHRVDVAENGQEAYESYIKNPPDLLLTDINMPVMNGLELIDKIRQHQTDIWVPIIILSALGDEKDIINGLESGADDYLSKPINLSILRAKIKSMQQVICLQKVNIETKKELRKANQDLEQEQILAKNLADNILDASNLEHSHVDYWLCPAKHFSGDLIAAAKTDDGKLYVMVADSAGHGLAAALPTLAVARIFHAMSEKGFTIPSIIREMNTATKDILPADRFVATALFSIDFKHKMIECWNGGLPAALVVSETGEVLHEFESRHMAISILPKEQFDTTTEIFQWQENCELIAYTDGVIEAQNPSGEQFGVSSLVSLIQSSSSGQRVSLIKDKVLSHLASELGEDDISLMAVNCDSEFEKE